MKISVIIPTLNEARLLPRLLRHLDESGAGEVLVCDANSEDGTTEIARQLGAKVMSCTERSRARQMNLAAEHATGDIFYFVHADTLPPDSWRRDVLDSVASGKEIGGYRFRFDSRRPLLYLNSFFTRFNRLYFRGGDQTLFLTRSLFEELLGFREDMCIMEEYDLMERAQALGHSFHLLPKATLVSARKYDENSYLRVQRANLKAMRDYRRGVSPEVIRTNYHRMLRHPKGD